MGISIQQIKKDWSDLDVEQKKSKIDELKSDPRKGIQTLVNQFRKELDREREQKELFAEMSKFETKLYSTGYTTICGADEVGRGPLAGPVVAASVILPKGCYIAGLNDSKKLTGKTRERLFEEIQEVAISIGVGVVEASEIDEINIYQASKKAMALAVEDLRVKPDYLLVDAMSLDLPIPQEAIIKGDAKSISIAAASVIAKEIRDRMMKELALEYPEYGFDQHMGYGTKQHLNAIKVHGICPEHRKSFSPIKEELN